MINSLRDLPPHMAKLTLWVKMKFVVGFCYSKQLFQLFILCHIFYRRSVLCELFFPLQKALPLNLKVIATVTLIES